MALLAHQSNKSPHKNVSLILTSHRLSCQFTQITKKLIFSLFSLCFSLPLAPGYHSLHTCFSSSSSAAVYQPSTPVTHCQIVQSATLIVTCQASLVNLLVFQNLLLCVSCEQYLFSCAPGPRSSACLLVETPVLRHPAIPTVLPAAINPATACHPLQFPSN